MGSYDQRISKIYVSVCICIVVMAKEDMYRHELLSRDKKSPTAIYELVHLNIPGPRIEPITRYVNVFYKTSGADPGFLERGFKNIKMRGFALLILSHFLNIP